MRYIFNLQSLDKGMHGKVKHTGRKHIEWAASWYINQDPSMKVIKRKNNGSMVIWLLPP